jgi:hypothetical protein
MATREVKVTMSDEDIIEAVVQWASGQNMQVLPENVNVEAQGEWEGQYQNERLVYKPTISFKVV